MIGSVLLQVQAESESGDAACHGHFGCKGPAKEKAPAARAHDFDDCSFSAVTWQAKCRRSCYGRGLRSDFHVWAVQATSGGQLQIVDAAAGCPICDEMDQNSSGTLRLTFGQAQASNCDCRMLHAGSESVLTPSANSGCKGHGSPFCPFWANPVLPAGA